MSSGCTGLPSSSVDVWPAQKIVRCAPLTWIAWLKPKLSCQVHGLTVRRSTTAPFLHPFVIVAPFGVRCPRPPERLGSTGAAAASIHLQHLATLLSQR